MSKLKEILIKLAVEKHYPLTDQLKKVLEDSEKEILKHYKPISEKEKVIDGNKEITFPTLEAPTGTTIIKETHIPISISEIEEIISKERPMFLKNNVFEFLNHEEAVAVRKQCRKEILDELKQYKTTNTKEVA